MTTPSATPHTGTETRVVDVAIENGHALVTIDNPPVNPLSVSVRKGPNAPPAWPQAANR